MTTKQEHQYQVGDIVIYETWGGGIRRVLVEEKSDDIKNDEPGFSGVLLDPASEPVFNKQGVRRVWGYDDQIVSVETAR